MKRIIGLLILATVLIAGGNVFALPTDVQLKEIGWQPGYDNNNGRQGYYGGSGAQWYTGEYIVQIGLGSQYSGIYDGFCVDPANSDSYYSLYTLQTLPNGQDFMAQQYQEAGYLFQTYGSAFTGVYNPDVAFDTGVAIWNIMFNGVIALNPMTQTQQNLVTQAGIWYNGGNHPQLSNKIVLAGSPPDSQGRTFNVINQDYLIKVPEPGTLVLLGAGLIGIGLGRLRRKSKS